MYNLNLDRFRLDSGAHFCLPHPPRDTAPLAPPRDTALRCHAFRAAPRHELTHTSRTRPVGRFRIMPCLMRRVLSRWRFQAESRRQRKCSRRWVTPQSGVTRLARRPPILLTHPLPPRDTALRCHASAGALRHNGLPMGKHLKQPRLSRIISRTGPAPMFGPIHIPAFYRIIVNVIQLLPQYHFILNDLWMRSFLPKLMCPVIAMRFAGKPHTLQ